MTETTTPPTPVLGMLDLAVRAYEAGEQLDLQAVRELHDLYCDLGLPLVGYAYLWMHARGYRPAYRPWPTARRRWCWFRPGSAESFFSPDEAELYLASPGAVLPAPLFAALPRGTFARARTFDTWEQAVEGLGRALDLIGDIHSIKDTQR